MNILLVITGLGMGGAEHVVVSLSDALAARGHNVILTYLTGEALVLPSNKSVEVVAINMKGKAGFFSAYSKLRKIVKEFKPDVVHSHMIHANLISRLLRLTVKVPRLVCTAHSNNEGGKLRMLAYLITDKLADITTNVSQQAVDEFISKRAVKLGKILSIPNGIDTDKFTFSMEVRKSLRNKLCVSGKKMILAVGRLDVPKDYPNLLQSIKYLSEKRDDFKVFIVGDGPLRNELELKVKQLQISEFVEFLGNRTDVSALMSATDLFVLSSAWEGFGLVVAEAMACERVVVATDCGGVSEVIGTAGFLLEPGDSSLLVNSINTALNLNEFEYSQIGQAARQRIIDNYSLTKNVNSYLNLYNS